MSRKAVLISLILAIALGAAALLLLRQRGPAPAIGPLLDFKPSAARHLQVTRPNHAMEIAERIGDGSDWSIACRAPGSDATIGWPASPTPVRAGLRILSTLTPIAEADRGTVLDADAASVEIGLDGGSHRSFRLGSRPLSGRVLLELVEPGSDRPEMKGRVFWVEADIARVLTDTGLLAWRERAAFPGLAADVARITMTGDAGRLALARVGGRWALREPVSAPADEQAVRTLLASLAAMQIKDFGENGIPESAGAPPPLGSIALETDQREPEGDSFLTRTSTRRIEFARVAGLAGDQVLVRLWPTTRTRHADGRVEDSAAGNYAYTVSLEDVGALVGAPDTYLSRIAATTPAADVGRVVIRGVGVGGGSARTLVRTIDGWSEPRPDGTPVPLSAEDRSGVEALLTLLCETHAEEATLRRPEGWSGAWTVDLQSLGGDPLDTVEIGLFQGASGAATVAHTPPVWRSFSAQSAGAILRWLDGALR